MSILIDNKLVKEITGRKQNKRPSAEKKGLTKELNQPLIRKFARQRVIALNVIDEICSADLVDMQICGIRV